MLKYFKTIPKPVLIFALMGMALVFYKDWAALWAVPFALLFIAALLPGLNQSIGHTFHESRTWLNRVLLNTGLILVYYFVLTPIALIRRLTGQGHSKAQWHRPGGDWEYWD